MHNNEIWQLYYSNGEPIPEVGWDPMRDNPEGDDNEIVGVAIVFLYRMTDDGLELLWQKRSDKVDRYPGYYDIAAGGHINLGETVVQGAIREAREEIGVVLEPTDLEFAFTKPHNKNRFAWIYFANWTGKPDEFHFDDEEVSEVKWVKHTEMEEFRKQYAKPPLAEDDLTFLNLDDWFKMHGYL